MNQKFFLEFYNLPVKSTVQLQNISDPFSIKHIPPFWHIVDGLGQNAIDELFVVVDTGVVVVVAVDMGISQ